MISDKFGSKKEDYENNSEYSQKENQGEDNREIEIKLRKKKFKTESEYKDIAKDNVKNRSCIFRSHQHRLLSLYFSK
jgi:hypothetical protein